MSLVGLAEGRSLPLPCNGVALVGDASIEGVADWGPAATPATAISADTPVAADASPVNETAEAGTARVYCDEGAALSSLVKPIFISPTNFARSSAPIFLIGFPPVVAA